jgi:hypothetical protein
MDLDAQLALEDLPGWVYTDAGERRIYPLPRNANWQENCAGSASKLALRWAKEGARRCGSVAVPQATLEQRADPAATRCRVRRVVGVGGHVFLVEIAQRVGV